LIPQSKIDEILQAATIEDVVGDYVRLKRRGANLTGLCPFHNEKTPSFSVSPAKGIYKCFGCGKAGNSVNFVMEHDGLGYIEALKSLADKYRIEWPQQENVNIDQEKALRSEKESLQILNNWAAEYFETQLWEAEEGQTIGLSYFEERGFRQDIIKKFKLGYSLDNWNHLHETAIAASYNEEVLVKAGLVKKNEQGKTYDAYRGRVMFTIHGHTGKVIAFAGRQLKKDDKSAKYVNSPETLLYHKSNELYGLFYAKNAIRQNDFVYLVEGYTDVISMHQAGIENVVASSGTSLTENQIKLIKRHTENVTVLYDGDAAGIKASMRGIDMLLEQGLNVKVVPFPDGEDPDSYSRKVGADDFGTYLKKESRDFILFKVKLLLSDVANDPLKKAQVTRDIVESIGKIPDGIKRMAFIKECAVLLDMNEGLLITELNKTRNDFLTQKEKEWEKSVEVKEQLIDLFEYQEPIELQENFEQEKRIIEILIRYGDFQVEESKSVTRFVVEKLIENEIIFDLEKTKMLFNEILHLYNSNIDISEAYFINNQNSIISSAAASFLFDGFKLSTGWEKKYSVLVNSPKENYKNEIMASISYLKLNRFQKIKKEALEKINEIEKSNHLEELEIYQRVYQQIKIFESEVAKEREIVILH
jgi:DNA primase